MDQERNILSIQDLSITFDGGHKALDNVNFSLEKGKITALIGGSGSGKSLSSLAIMGLLPQNANVQGAVKYKGKDLLKQSEEEWQAIRGKEIAMIFQEPMSALNPLMKIGNQIAESLQIHQKKLSKKERFAKTIEWLRKVNIPDPELSFHKYPHQMSGGQKQRVMIAMAMINEPNILIADEPTTALDVLVQREILELIKELQLKTETSVLFITHDLALAQSLADHILEMKNGRIVDRSLHKNPTQFKEILSTENDLLLDVQNVSVIYPQKDKILKAVDNVSLQLYKNETVGLVGASGCGKTTLSKAILGLEKVASGSIFFKGKNLANATSKEWINLRKDIQIIFQDPYASLNPRIKIGNAIAEPLKVHTHNSSKIIKDQVVELLEDVHLKPSDYEKYPHEFSGGQRQRICIARALGLHPSLVICDESVAALDIIVQAQVLELLSELQQKFGMTYLFITHDMNVVKKIADRVIVMNNGEIVESGITKEVLELPKNDYTKELLAAIP